MRLHISFAKRPNGAPECLLLRVREIKGDGEDCVCDVRAQSPLSRFCEERNMISKLNWCSLTECGFRMSVGVIFYLLPFML